MLTKLMHGTKIGLVCFATVVGMLACGQQDNTASNSPEMPSWADHQCGPRGAGCRVIVTYSQSICELYQPTCVYQADVAFDGSVSRMMAIDGESDELWRVDSSYYRVSKGLEGVATLMPTYLDLPPDDDAAGNLDLMFGSMQFREGVLEVVLPDPAQFDVDQTRWLSEGHIRFYHADGLEMLFDVQQLDEPLGPPPTFLERYTRYACSDWVDGISECWLGGD